MIHFAAFVYERYGLYDVVVVRAKTAPVADKYRTLVATERVVALSSVTMSVMTQYMQWKFATSQVNIRRPTAYGLDVTIKSSRTNGEFTQIKADLDWILSILHIEFDYHAGKKSYMDQMDEYKRVANVGFLKSTIGVGSEKIPEPILTR